MQSPAETQSCGRFAASGVAAKRDGINCIGKANAIMGLYEGRKVR